MTSAYDPWNRSTAMIKLRGQLKVRRPRAEHALLTCGWLSLSVDEAEPFR